MKAIILCGGRGRRMESDRAKALVKVGKRPLIFYTIRQYILAGIRDFVLCGGYQIDQIDALFAKLGHVLEYHDGYSRYGLDLFHVPCTVELYDTGIDTKKVDRLRSVLKDFSEEMFCLSYCDIICDVDISKLIAKHRKNGATMTITVVNPQSRYGHVICDESFAIEMREKPILEDIWINGGIMVASAEVIPLLLNLQIEGDIEDSILANLAAAGKLGVYRHRGFWRSIETQKDVEEMRSLGDSV